jgi:hypothetical protein
MDLEAVLGAVPEVALEVVLEVVVQALDDQAVGAVD